MTHYTKKSFMVTQSIGFLLTKARNVVSSEMDAALKHLDISSQQMGIILSLGRGAANTPFELAKLLDVDTGAMTRILDKLESRKLLKRNRSDEDRRVVCLELTALGHALTEEITEIAPQVLNTHLREFTKAEFAELKRLLAKFIGQE